MERKIHRRVVYRSVELETHHRVVHRSVAYYWAEKEIHRRVVYRRVEQEIHRSVVHRSVVNPRVELYKNTHYKRTPKVLRNPFPGECRV